jgi:mono/diheme cytochrome c family protein
MTRSVWFALALLAAACAESDPSRTNLEFVPEMIDSVPYDSFAPNPVTRDGKTLMTPARGSIPRGYAPFSYGAGPEEAARAGRELQNPLLPTPDNLVRGERVFRTFCTPCHGTAGAGDGPVIPRFPQPPSLTAPHANQLPDGRIAHIISRGQGIMPAHASQIEMNDRWKAVLYIRSLQHRSQGGSQ